MVEEAYYSHHYISNSDLKRLRKIMDPKFEDPADLKEILAFGTLFHKLVLEPHKVTHLEQARDDYPLAKKMRDQFLTDKLCRDIMMVPDIRREHEYYRSDAFGVGIPTRCKVDFESPRMMSICGELKGLSIRNDRQLDEAVDRFDYDQAVAFYLDMTGRKHYFMAAPSKVVEQTFKRFIDRNHIYYTRGRIKVRNSLKQFLQVFPNEYAHR